MLVVVYDGLVMAAYDSKMVDDIFVAVVSTVHELSLAKSYYY